MRALLLALTALSLAATPALAQQAAPVPTPSRIPPTLIDYAPYPPGRLDGSVVPTSYKLDLVVDPAKPEFSGHVTIEATLKQPAQYLYLHGRDLKQVGVRIRAGTREMPGTWEQVDDTGVARIVFAEPQPAGPITLDFWYKAEFGTGPAGMFRVKVGEDWYSWTQFESIDARAAFPSFDEPGIKTPFEITLRTPKGLTAVSNAPEASKTEEYGQDVHRFAPTLPLPTYLVAMMVGPFATLDGTVAPTAQREHPLPLRIVTTQQNKDRIAFALEGSKGIVTLLEDYFGQGFPYPKLDQITSPIMPGAMENAGADLYNDGILVMDEDASTSRKRTFGMVVSHELAHQWFGDLVTPAWWDDIWLNESFANWMGYRIGNAWRPDLNIAGGALAEGFQAMNTDALVAGRPIRQPITKNAQADEAFDSITYGKGGHVVAMIAGFMGDTRFRDGVRRYMAAHRYGKATSIEFFAAMAEAAGDPRIVPAMRSFVEQQGVPLVTFGGGEGGRYTVTQSGYARLGTAAPAAQWGVPLCVRRGGDSKCELLIDRSGSVAVGGSGPLVPNAGGTGYYRFELPKAGWDALIASGATLPSGEALAVADSLRASFLAGRASATQLAALARTMASNPDSYASDAAADGLDTLASSGLLDDKASAAYRKFVDGLYRPQLAALGFSPKRGAHSGEPAERIQRRLQIVARLVSSARDSDLKAQLRDAAARWLAGETAALDPALYGVALDAHVEAGGLVAARALAERALASQDPSFRPAALNSIGTSGNKDVAAWLLGEFADPRLRTSERLGLIRSVVATGGTREQGYIWLKANFAQLMSGGGGIFLASRLPGMLNGFCSAERADEIGTQFRPLFAGKTGALELERTIERVRSCGVLKLARRDEASREIAKLK